MEASSQRHDSTTLTHDSSINWIGHWVGPSATLEHLGEEKIMVSAVGNFSFLARMYA
jgi:hypothetical protein